MSDNKPREFWIRHESILPGYGCRDKHAFEIEQTNSLHVIEYQAYTDALKMIETLTVENERCKEIAERDGKDYSAALKMIEEMAEAIVYFTSSGHIEKTFPDGLTKARQSLESYRKFKGECE